MSAPCPERFPPREQQSELLRTLPCADNLIIAKLRLLCTGSKSPLSGNPRNNSSVNTRGIFTALNGKSFSMRVGLLFRVMKIRRKLRFQRRISFGASIGKEYPFRKSARSRPTVCRTDFACWAESQTLLILHERLPYFQLW